MSPVDVLVHLCVAAVGAASWIAVNAIWTELPIIVYDLPEGWNLPSYLSVIVQLGSIGVLVQAVCQKYRSSWLPHIVLSLVVCGLIGCILLAIFWNFTIGIGGSQHSVALFTIFFFLSYSCCTSNVTFIPFIGRLKPMFMTTYFVGMGLSGLIPSALALVQGSGHIECIYNSSLPNTSDGTPHQIPPRFSFNVFFAVISIVQAFAVVSVTVLAYTKAARCDYAPPERTESDERLPGADMNVNVVDSPIGSAESTEAVDVAVLNKSNVLSVPAFILILLILMVITGLMNAVLPAVQSYSCLPYGQSEYHYAVVFANIANPIACFIPFFVQLGPRIFKIIGFLTLLTVGAAAYCIGMAALSPQPLLVKTTAGSVIIVLMWTIVTGLCAYIRAVIGEYVREHRCVHMTSERSLFWYGAATQLGSVIGAVVLFPLVNVYHVFEAAPMCQRD